LASIDLYHGALARAVRGPEPAATLDTGTSARAADALGEGGEGGASTQLDVGAERATTGTFTVFVRLATERVIGGGRQTLRERTAGPFELTTTRLTRVGIEPFIETDRRPIKGAIAALHGGHHHGAAGNPLVSVTLRLTGVAILRPAHTHGVCRERLTLARLTDRGSGQVRPTFQGEVFPTQTAIGEADTATAADVIYSRRRAYEPDWTAHAHQPTRGYTDTAVPAVGVAHARLQAGGVGSTAGGGRRRHVDTAADARRPRRILSAEAHVIGHAPISIGATLLCFIALFVALAPAPYTPPEVNEGVSCAPQRAPIPEPKPPFATNGLLGFCVAVITVGGATLPIETPLPLGALAVIVTAPTLAGGEHLHPMAAGPAGVGIRVQVSAADRGALIFALPPNAGIFRIHTSRVDASLARRTALIVSAAGRLSALT